MHCSFHRRTLGSQSSFKIKQTSEKDFQLFSPSDKRVKSDFIEIYPDQLKKVIQDYLELRKQRQQPWGSGNALSAGQAQPSLSDYRMKAIMMLVNSTSKPTEVYRQLINAGGHLVFVQLIHNTDSDSLLLLMIKDFLTLQVHEVDFSIANGGEDLKILIERNGISTT